MYLKSLEINGFKSFAKKGNLDFLSPIVAIVGPNGSGKSNVAEAFRFVLGEQSMKSMRGKRGEDLIFNGSKTVAKQNRAGVKLTFDNTRRIFNLDFDEVVLERVVYRDSANEYSINGTQVRLKDVLELLASANIGASGHHIISQGEADRILNSSIRERRAMIEDALGLKIYQYKREESIRKLDKTAENMRQVESLRKEIAPHIRFLEKQMEKVAKAELLREELIGAYREYLKREEVYLHLSKEKLDSDISKPMNELSLTEREIQDTRKLIDESQNRDEKSRTLLLLEEAMSMAESRESRTMSAISRIDGERSAQERALSRAKASEKVNSGINVPLSEIENLHNEVLEIAHAGSLVSDAESLRGVILSIVDKVKVFINTRGANNEELHSLEREIEEDLERLAQERMRLEEDLRVASAERAEKRQEYNQLRTLIEKESEQGREAERHLFVLMQKRTELTNQIQLIERRREEISRDEALFRAELVEAQALVGILAIRYSDYELTNSEIESEDRQMQLERRRRIEKMKIRLEEMGGAGGSDIKQEYEEVKGRDEYFVKELADLEKSSATLKQLITELEEKLQVHFSDGMVKINKAFGEFFALMFGGGHAALDLVREPVRRKKKDGELSDGEDSEDDEDLEEGEEGVDISVSLPHKRVKGLAMLSGGERALTSIALLFAISQVNPPPFIILDETDAALDEANSRKYGDMVANLAKYSQLIVITHNRETMSRAGILYGITMGSDGYSKLLSVKFDEAVAVAK